MWGFPRRWVLGLVVSQLRLGEALGGRRMGGGDATVVRGAVGGSQRSGVVGGRLLHVLSVVRAFALLSKLVACSFELLDLPLQCWTTAWLLGSKS